MSAHGFHTFTRDPQPIPFGPFSPIEACPHCRWPSYQCLCDEDLPAYQGADPSLYANISQEKK